jgi:hypothetical protein
VACTAVPPGGQQGALLTGGAQQVCLWWQHPVVSATAAKVNPAPIVRMSIVASPFRLIVGNNP